MATKKKETTEETKEYIYVPDIPAQMIEDNVSTTISEPVSVIIEEKKESDEILFLRRILAIQHDGGFGRHLNDLINERIKDLKNVK